MQEEFSDVFVGILRVKLLDWEQNRGAELTVLKHSQLLWDS